MLLTANITVQQKVIVTTIRIALIVFTRLWRTPWHTFNGSRAASLL